MAPARPPLLRLARHKEGCGELLAEFTLEQTLDAAVVEELVRELLLAARAGPGCAELKAKSGGARLEVTLSEPRADAAETLAGFAAGPVHVSHDGRQLRAPVRRAAGLATTIVRALDDAAITVDHVEVHQPSLDDVFFALTGHPGEVAEPQQVPA